MIYLAINDVNIAFKGDTMYDPIIQELFPDRRSIPLNIIFSSAHPGTPGDWENDLVDESFKNIKLSLDYCKGEFDLSHYLSHYSETFFPSSFAQRNMLYLQMLFSSTFNKDHYTKRTNLPSYLLAQTFWGKGKLLYEQKEYELLPDDVFLIDCRKPHEYWCDSEDGWGYRFLHFDGTPMPAYYSQINTRQDVKFNFDNNSNFHDLFKEIILTNYGSKPNKEIISNRIITDMITELLCLCPQYQEIELPDTIIDLCNFLQNTFQQKLSLDEIAKKAGLSKYHLSREFKKYTGKTIVQYIIDCRIALAQRLLRYGNMSINQIAEYVGFEDHNGFYRAFHQRECMSPSAYRKYWNTF